MYIFHGQHEDWSRNSDCVREVELERCDLRARWQSSSTCEDTDITQVAKETENSINWKSEQAG